MSSVWLAPKVAWRYLRSKKRHGAVSVITWISVVGVAVATAATLCVLSVFNGFQHVLEGKLELLSPDVLVEPTSGRTMNPSSESLKKLSGMPGVKSICPVVMDRALAVYNGQEMPVRLMGVDTVIFAANTALDSLLIAGEGFSSPAYQSIHNSTDSSEPLSSPGSSEPLSSPEPEFSEEAILEEELGSETPQTAIASAGVGMRLGIAATQPDALTIIVPRREGTVNIANPMASLMMEDMAVGGIYQSLQADYDKDYVLTSLDAARNLLSIPDSAVTALYVYASPGTDSHILATELRKALPPSVKVKDRLQQHESQFRMSNIEKWITYLLLAFILVIASFNLISSLAMLVIDKQENLGVLSALGASRRRIGNIFAWESGFVTLIGGVSGLLLGIVLVLIQQHWGIIKLNADPGTLILTSYPVKLSLGDLPAIAAPLAIIGIATAWLTARFARSRIAQL